MNLIIGNENCGNFYLQSNTFNKLFKIIFPNLKIIEKNTSECNLIIKTPLSGKMWNNDNNKPYIYWSGESNLPEIKSNKNNYLEIYTTIENKDYLYIPYCLESYHIYKNRIDTNINRPLLLAYCHSNKVFERETFYNLFIEKTDTIKCKAYGYCYGNYKETQEYLNDSNDFQGYGLINKYKNHKFVMAFENIKKDGYITEKIVNAFYSGAIPIYWGSDNIKDFFNEKAFINVDDFNSFDECIDYILNLSDKDREKMVNEPIYTNSELINLINDEFNMKNENKTLENYLNKIKDFLKNVI